MRIKVNHLTNVVTGEHSNSYRREGDEPRPEITVPHLRLRLAIEEAAALATALIEAVKRAELEAESAGASRAR